MNPVLSSLPPNERKALATCGILNDEQLSKVDADVLLRDLAMAAEAFPEADFSIPEKKLRRLCRQAAGEQNDSEEYESDEDWDTAEERTETAEPIGHDAPLPRALPELSLRHHQHHSTGGRASRKNMTTAPGVSSSVHCSRPIATYLAAVFTLVFYISISSLLALPFLIFTGYLDGEYLFPCAGAFVLSLLPYLFIGIHCHCCVCKMKFFTLVHYNRNRHAHAIPFLGLTSLSTALHIIFRLWYRCPACGTALRLFRSRHSRRHR